jgi:hypothetical protein
MRAAAYFLVLISLALSLGGVRYTHASEADAVKAVSTAGSSPMCSAQAAPQVREVAVRPLAAGGQRAVALNTRGYNYRRPGELPVPPSPERSASWSSR